MSGFNGLTVVILASNERESLRQTIRSTIKKCNSKDLSEIIVFLKSEDCASAEELKTFLSEDSVSVPVRGYVQKDRDLHHAVCEIPGLIKSSHMVIMFADFATDASSLPQMIEKAKQFPGAIICAAKWHKRSKVYGYSRVRMLCSRTMNKLAAFFLHTTGNDLFSYFQIYPLELVSQFCLTNPKTSR